MLYWQISHKFPKQIRALPTFAGRLHFNSDNFTSLHDLDMFVVSSSPSSLVPDAAAGQILRSQLDPSSNAPRDQTRRKEPLLRLVLDVADLSLSHVVSNRSDYDLEPHNLFLF